MKSIYGLEIIANIALNKAISKIGEKIYRLLYKTYFRTLHIYINYWLPPSRKIKGQGN